MTQIDASIVDHSEHVDHCPNEPERSPGEGDMNLLEQGFTQQEIQRLCWVDWYAWLNWATDQECFYAYKIKNHIAKSSEARWRRSDQFDEGTD